MLPGEQCSGYQNGDLFTVLDGDEGCSHCHFGFAKANIATHQPVHHFGRTHIPAHRLNGGLLVRGFLKGELFAEALPQGFIQLALEALSSFSPCVDLQQLCGDVVGFFTGPTPGFFPLFAAKAMQGGCVGVGAGVAGDQVQRAHRHIELVVVGVLQQQKFGRVAVNFKGL